jgi:hypothetical protein
LNRMKYVRSYQQSNLSNPTARTKFLVESYGISLTNFPSLLQLFLTHHLHLDLSLKSGWIQILSLSLKNNSLLAKKRQDLFHWHLVYFTDILPRRLCSLLDDNRYGRQNSPKTIWMFEGNIDDLLSFGHDSNLVVLLRWSRKTPTDMFSRFYKGLWPYWS